MTMTHSDVHAEIARMLLGTRLQSFMVTTQSIQHESGEVAVEWSTVISSGREPVIYQRSRDPRKLIDDVRRAILARRPFFDIPRDPALKTFDTAPPKDTALPDPSNYSPTGGAGEF